MNSFRKQVSLVLLTIVYLLGSFRYFPGRWLDSLLETLMHIVTMAPFTIGSTLVGVSIFQKVSGSRVPIGIIIRIFLTISIVMEFFLGLYNYLGQS